MKRHAHKFTVSFGDCDPQGIVNYPNFFLWFDRNNERLFGDAGLKLPEMFRDYAIDGIPLVDARSSFTGPARVGDTLEIESWVEEWKDKVFVVRHQIANNGEIIASGTEVRTWVVRDPQAENGIRAVPIPREIVGRFQ